MQIKTERIGLIVVLLLCTLTAEARKKQIKLKLPSAKRVEVAASMHGMTADKPHYHADPAGGVMISYNSEDGLRHATLYVYPMPVALQPEYLLRRHHRDVLEEIRQAHEQSRRHLVHTGHAQQALDELTVLYDQFVLDGEGGQWKSELYLGASHHHYIKLRLSSAPGALDFQQSLTLARDLMGSIRFKKVKERQVKIVLDANEFNSDLSAGDDARGKLILIYNVGMVNALNDGAFIDTLSRDLQVYEAVAMVQRGLREETASDAVGFDTLLDAGLLDEFVWSLTHRAEEEKSDSLDWSAWQAWREAHDPEVLAPLQGLSRLLLE